MRIKDLLTLLRSTATALGGDQFTTQLGETRLQQSQVPSSGLVLLRPGHLEAGEDILVMRSKQVYVPTTTIITTADLAVT